ncbi:MAG: VOC family protein [Proteobacteria bacterium]|nr:VOC family protein [Pseudomonadota bacterium]
MSLIKIEDIAHVRFQVPDLDRQDAFLRDFGLTPVAGDGAVRHYRGLGPSPFLYALQSGEASFLALGLRAAGVADLARLAEAEGAPVEALDAPGGGQVVRLKDPDGFTVEVVAGQAAASAARPPERQAWNNAFGHPRQGAVKRVGQGPAAVMRLGHAVLNVTDFRASERWYKDRFGFITSDEIAVSPQFTLGAFMRCDRGDTPTDHHTLFLAQGPQPKFNHAAFEVADLEDLMVGHQHLQAGGHAPEWGVGRHILGSQVFDYWRDPYGYALEHWTDGDLLTAASGSNVTSIADLLGVQWGPAAPPTMA